MSKAMAAAWRRLSQIEGFAAGPSTFAEDDEVRAYWINAKQVVNLVDPHRVEIRVTKSVIRTHRDRLRSDSRVELRRNPSDWLTVTVSGPGDADLVVELAGFSAEAHRSLKGPGGTVVPEGADLARRRRFH